MALDGFIFDVDGVLIDSNSTHVEAWERALRQHGFRVAADRLSVEMGKGGDKLVPDVLGAEIEKSHGEDLRATETKEFSALALERGLTVAPGARELITELRRRGLATALATSSNDEQLELAERASGVEWRKLVDEVVGGSDVSATKPAPDVVQAAVEKLGLSPAQCVMLGDSPWDAYSATRAGVVLLGVTRGGNSAETLLGAGARSVYRDPADLLARVEEALRQASPGAAHLDRAALDRLMRAALAAAEQGLAEGEVPIGCVIADGGGNIVGRGHNVFNRTRDKTAHAEMDAFRRIAGRVQADDTGDLILVSTLEPCVMCTGAAMEVGVDTVVFGLSAPSDGGSTRVKPPVSPENQACRIVGGIRAADSRALFERWIERPDRNRAQEPYARQLLAMTRSE